MALWQTGDNLAESGFILMEAAANIAAGTQASFPLGPEDSEDEQEERCSSAAGRISADSDCSSSQRPSEIQNFPAVHCWGSAFKAGALSTLNSLSKFWLLNFKYSRV